MADEQDKAAADSSVDPTAALDLELGEPVEAELGEEEQIAAAAASVRPARKTTAEPATGKGHSTPKRKRAGAGGEEVKRTTPAQFVRESIAELKKVIWLTPSQWQQYFVVVLVFVLIMIGIVSALDLAFGSLLFSIFGAR